MDNDNSTNLVSFALIYLGVSHKTYENGMFFFGLIGAIWVVFQIIIKIIELKEKYKKKVVELFNISKH